MLEILDLVLSNSIILICSAMMGVLFINVLLSWFFPTAEGPFFNFIRNLNDFLVFPARVILDKTGLFADLPLDMAHMLTMVSLWLITMIFTFF